MTSQSTTEPFEDASSEGPAVHGFLHRPATPSGDALVLTHGAGSDCRAPLLVAIASAFAARGFLVLRSDLPFRRARSSGPPPLSAAAHDREGLRRAVLSDVLRVPHAANGSATTRRPHGSVSNKEIRQ